MWIETKEPEWPLINADKIVAIRMMKTQEGKTYKTRPEIPEEWSVFAYSQNPHPTVDGDEEWTFELCTGTRQECRDTIMMLIKTQTMAAVAALR